MVSTTNAGRANRLAGPTRPSEERCRQVVVACAVTTFAAIVVGLVEWARSGATGFVVLNPVTAACLAISGICLVMLLRETAGATLEVLAAAGILVLLVASARIVDFLFDTGFSLDRLVLKPERVHDMVGRRMGPGAAFGLLLTGAAVLGLRMGGRGIVAAQMMGLGVLAVALLFLVGHAYGIAEDFPASAVGSMSLPAAVGLAAVAVGLLFVRPRNGLMAAVTADSSGGAAARALLPAAILIPVAFGWLPFAGARSGWATLEVGVAIVVVLVILFLFAVVGWMAATLNQTEEALGHLERHDELTGLPNRMAFLDGVREAAARAARSGAPYAVLQLDVDDLGSVNEERGEVFGDELLRCIGQRVARCARDTDVCARLEGDTFAVLCEDITEESARTLGGRIVRSVGEPYDWGEGEVRVGISGGVALGDPAKADAEALLRCCARALASAKAQGKGRVLLAEGPGG